MSFRCTSSLLALLALSTPALADVTPAEVWQGWIDYYKVNGYTVTEGTRDEAGETLTLTDVVFSRDMPDGKLAMTVPKVVLQATGDGKVRTTIPDPMTAALDGTDSDGKPFAARMSAAMPGAEVVTSGSAADMTHEGTAPTITARLDEITMEGQTLTDVASVTSTDTTYSQHVVAGDLTRMDYTVRAGQTDATVKAAFKDEDGKDGSVDGTVSIAALEGSGNAALPMGADMETDMAAALRAGLAFAGNFKAGSVSGKFDVTDAGDDGAPVSSAMVFSADGFSLDGSLSADGLNYQADGDASSFDLTSSDMPFPVKYATESASVTLQIPVSKSDTPAPFKFGYALNGLTLGDDIWNLFDAEKKLPRDPASVELDLTGMVRLAADLFDPENMKPHGDDDHADEADDAEAADAAKAGADDSVAADAAEDKAAEDKAAEDSSAEAAAADTAETADETADAAADEAADEEPMPFQPTEITLNQLLIDAVGAKLTASGALTVPEGGDINAPIGTISARYEGVNKLIDTLVEMGVVSAEEVTGYRMMLAMFTKPAAEGGDVLTTELEFKEGGSVFANGQQVK